MFFKHRTSRRFRLTSVDRLFPPGLRPAVHAALLIALACVGRVQADAPRPTAEHNSRFIRYPARDLTGQGLPADAVKKLTAAPSDARRLLVRFKPGRSAVSRRTAHAAVAGEEIKQFRSVDGLVLVRVPVGSVPTALTAYASNPNVLYAEPDYEMTINVVPNDPSFDLLWGLHNTGQLINGDPGTPGADIRAPEAWDLWTGDPNFRVAIIDTGINYNHPDLAANVWTNPGEIPGNGVDDDGNGWIDDVHGYDFENNDSDPLDDNRHGSHVGGTIGAAGNNGVGVTGINWQCKIVALKAFDAGGSGSLSNILAAMDYVIANNLRVSNNSYGGGGFSQAFRDTIELSQSVGHVFVAAAGNSSNNVEVLPMYPAAYDLPNIISVAAMTNNDELASFSNFGPISVDLGAPGQTVYSTVLGTGYGFLSGTSMATPHVTGTVALVMSRSPELDWAAVRDRILFTVRRVDALAAITATGGMVDARAALGDCNGNGVPDEDDIANGTSEDCTGDGIPDECDPDCNANGVPDSCDIGAGTSTDCSGNRIPDECEPDCNANGVADICDVFNGVSPDCNFNVVPDECEVAGDGDCNGNGVPDDCDVADRTSPDCNGNGLPDECEPDCNGNGNPDDCDLDQGFSQDCNDTGVPDDCDILAGTSEDCSGNGIPDECEPDCNSNGVPDSCDPIDPSGEDCNGNEVPDECEPDEDCDGNGVRDICDIGAQTHADCNRNSVPDLCDIAAGSSEDCNGDGVPDECQPNADCNGNGVRDICDIAAGISTDCGGDGIPDECEPDCNGNGKADGCDISNQTSADGNGNGVPDECDFIVFVDAAATGSRNGLSWANAYRSLQRAIADDRATEVWVAAGVYTPGPPGDRTLSFQLRNGLAVYGGFQGDETRLDQRNPTANETILSGDVLGNDDQATSGIAVEDACCIGHNTPGCGVASCEAAVCALFPRCCNDAWDGGCAYAAVNDWCCDLCTTENYCDNSLRVVETGGTDATAVLDGFTITRGRANRQFGAFNSGAAIHNVGGSPTIRNCRIIDNHSIYVGGAMDNWEGSDPTLINCTFMNNSGLGGGAIFNWLSDPKLINCAFVANTSHAGGAIRNWPDSNPVLVNCTLVANAAVGMGGSGGGLHSDQGARPILRNCILWDNAVPDAGAPSPEEVQIEYHHATPPFVDFTDIQGWSGILGGVGNFGLNPRFVDADGLDNIVGTSDDDLRPGPGSPVVDAGSNASVRADIRFDIIHQPRFSDDIDILDRGIGMTPVVDLGAYERLADCNGNGVFDETDIAQGTSPDCNGNDVPDECDVALGRSEDCDANGVPDECQPDCDGDGSPDACALPPWGSGSDCNGNAVPDDCDLAAGVSDDCDGNGVPDECEPDCNANGLTDACDIAAGTSPDCNGNGVPDECEPDCNGNGVADACDIAGGTSEDCNANQIPDECDIAGNVSGDCNGNGVPDECEPDEDGDNVPDDCDQCPGFADGQDCNGNGTADGCDVRDGISLDLNGNGAPDECEPPQVAAEAGRYVFATPLPGPNPVALIVSSPDYPCLLSYAQPDGTLGQTPAFRTPDEWGTVGLRGLSIVPDTFYNVQAEFEDGLRSASAGVRTGRWGDAAGDLVHTQWEPPDGDVDILDAVACIERFQGVDGAPAAARCDLFPAIPDGLVDIADIIQIINAFVGAPYPYPPPCP